MFLPPHCPHNWAPAFHARPASYSGSHVDPTSAIDYVDTTVEPDHVTPLDLYDRIDFSYMIGSFASGANASLVAKNGTKTLF